VSSDFHLLFWYLQNIYIFSAAHVTYIKTKRCSHPGGLEKPEIDSTGQSTPSGMVCMCTWLYMAQHTRGARVRVKPDILKNFK
jgi:hypothetical protein